jgi:hypothetical protein
MTQLTSQEFVTIPVTVEAWRLELDNLDLVAQWCKGRRRGQSVIFPKIRNKAKLIDSQDNNHYAIPGDVVVKTSKGFIKMSGDEFEKRFTEASQRISVF